jgi:hypothetical protein
MRRETPKPLNGSGTEASSLDEGVASTHRERTLGRTPGRQGEDPPRGLAEEDMSLQTTPTVTLYDDVSR